MCFILQYEVWIPEVTLCVKNNQFHTFHQLLALMNGKRICTAKIYFQFKNFYIIYFIIFFSLLQFLADPTHLPIFPPLYLSSISVSHIHKKRKTTKNKKLKLKQTKKINKTSNVKKKHTKNRVCFVLINYSCHETCSGMWLVYPVTLHGRKLIFPFPVGINYRWHLD